MKLKLWLQSNARFTLQSRKLLCILLRWGSVSCENALKCLEAQGETMPRKLSAQKAAGAPTAQRGSFKWDHYIPALQNKRLKCKQTSASSPSQLSCLMILHGCWTENVTRPHPTCSKHRKASVWLHSWHFCNSRSILANCITPLVQTRPADVPQHNANNSWSLRCCHTLIQPCWHVGISAQKSRTCSIRYEMNLKYQQLRL